MEKTEELKIILENLDRGIAPNVFERKKLWEMFHNSLSKIVG